jgi:hypothetical protein
MRCHYLAHATPAVFNTNDGLIEGVHNVKNELVMIRLC